MNKLKYALEVYNQQQYQQVLDLSEEILDIAFNRQFSRGVAEAYFIKARALNRMGRRQKALEVFEKAAEQFDIIGDNQRTASVYNNAGLTLKAMGEFRKAIESGEKALHYVQQQAPNKLQFHILNNLGNSYQSLALFKKASTSYFEALEVLKSEEDSTYKQRMQAEVFINLGLVYYEQKLYSRSEEIYQEALNIFQKEPSSPQLATVYNNLGILFTKTDEINKANAYLKMAYNLCIELDNKVEATVCKANTGKIYLAQKDYIRAISTYEEVINEFEALEAPAYLPSSYLGLGETLIEAGKIDKAELALLKGLQIALRSGQRIKELQLYEGLISYHKSVGELELAVMYYDLYSALSQDLNDQQIGRLIGQLELQDLLKRRDLALETLENQAEFLQFQLGQRTLLLIFLVITIILAVCFFILALKQYRLKTQNRSIALEQKVLRAQLNPHFIFNALGAIQHYLINHTPEKATIYLAKFSKLMRSILECSRANSSRLSVELENMQNYLDLQSLRFSKPFDYSIVMGKGINPDQIEIPPLLVQPILENAIEHGLIPKKGGELLVTITLENQGINITVEDNGVGVNQEKLVDNVKEGRVSLGNTIVYERLNLLNRKSKHKIRFEVLDRSLLDQNLSGTKASLSIPLN